MSYPAILLTLPAFSPVSRRRCFESAGSAHPSQLLDWLRLAARQVFGCELAAKIEPYRACSRCISQVKWCGDGVPARSDHSDHSYHFDRPDHFDRPEPGLGPLDLWQAGITPLTPSLILGAKADPYCPAEAVLCRTRGLLERLVQAPRRAAAAANRRGARGMILAAAAAPQGDSPHEAQEPNPAMTGLEISILTRSPLLLRDLDLLADLDQRHAVTVAVLIPAADPRLARRLERTGPANPPGSPASLDDRFELVHTLASHGIATEVLCTPIEPGLNNSVAVLRALFDRAHQAGAFDVRPAPRHPGVPPTATESRQLLALFHRLRLERGFPRTVAARG
jgi:hypothetical protein